MKKLSGFSLMEMMIVLLIVSVVAAASAPMVNKKLLNAASDKSPWVWTGSSKSIAYNLQGSDPQAAVVGAVTRPTAASNARFYIHTNNQTPQIALGHGNSVPMKIIGGGSSLVASNDISRFGADKHQTILGYGTKYRTNDTNTVVVGSGANAAQSYTTVIGSGAKAGEASAVAIGAKSNARGGYSVAIGSGNSTWIGANASGFRSTAIGAATNASGERAFAMGFEAKATEYGATAIGSASNSQSRQGIAIGVGAKTLNQPDNIAIGSWSAASSANSIAIGAIAKASGNENPISIGASSQATAANAIAIGYLTKADHAGTIAIGRSANVPNYDLSIAIGADAKAEGKRNTVLGANAAVEGLHDASVAIGYNAVASAAYATAIGHNARATYTHQITLGTANDVVYIPGNLIVGKTSYLGASAGRYTVYMNTMNEDNGEDWFMSYVRGRGGYKDRLLDVYGKDQNKVLKRGLNTDALHTIMTSDRRLKNVGKTFVGGLNEIKKLEVFNYTFKSDKSKTPRVGVMAQDLQKIFPNAVTKGEDGFLRIRMEDMFYALVNAVKELATRSENHDKQIAELTKQNKELQKTIEKLEKRINDLEKK